MAHKTRETIRTAVVLLCGILLFLVASVCLERLLAPNDFVLIHKMYTPLPPEQSALFYKQLSHSADITVYVVDPLAAIIVGLFVGLLQRRNAVILAGCCLIPDFIISQFDDTRKLWEYSLKGISIYAFHHALPFAGAMVTAAACQYLISLRHRATTTA